MDAYAICMKSKRINISPGASRRQKLNRTTAAVIMVCTTPEYNPAVLKNPSEAHAGTCDTAVGG
jgi:hypothetical protein